MKSYRLPLIKFQNEEKANLEEVSRRERINSMPVRITLNTNKNCNLSCKLCGFSTKAQNLGKDRMKLDLLEIISEELFSTAWEVVPSTVGEPLLFENFLDLVHLIGEYQCRIELYTNGMLLNEGMSRKLLPYLADLKVSFDAASRSVFEDLRLKSNYETIIHNITKFNELKNNFKYVLPPTITFQVTLARSNIKELSSLVELASNIGIDRIAASHAYIFNQNLKSESLIFNRDLSDKNLFEAYNLSKNLNVNTFFPRPFNGLNNSKNYLFKAKTCSYLYKETWINANGDVHPCFLPDSPVLGNLHEESFQEIWNGSLYRNMRRTVNDEKPLFSRCKNCPIRMQFDLHFTKGYNEKGFLLYEPTKN